MKTLLFLFALPAFTADFGCIQVEPQREGKLVSPIANRRTLAVVSFEKPGPCDVIGLPDESQHPVPDARSLALAREHAKNGLSYWQGDTAWAAHFGFDRNLYPGDAALASLHRTFAFTGYWLNNPPGAGASSWLGKRALLRKNGFGFLVLFNGRLFKDLRGVGVAEHLGAADGARAVELARKEGFPERSILFLDQEEGGRLVPEQLAYVLAWMKAVAERKYGVGIYCSGIDVREGDGTVINTAKQIREVAGTRPVHFFVYNDSCPPSSGCAYPRQAPDPQRSGIEFAEVWQMAQSPRRPALTARCASTYSAQNLCLAPGSTIDIDLSTATSADPSHGR